ncbi:MAG: aldo/keto reductase [Candidatus Bathyarchaeia archaeon]
MILGKSGLLVSRLCIGTDYSEIYGRSLIGRDILVKGFEMGVNFWDSSESYGSYPSIREAVREIGRDKVVITSKSYSRNVEGARKDLEDALREIGTSYLDIFMLHAVDTLDDFKSRRNVLDFLLEMKRNEVIKAVGASTHSPVLAMELAKCPEIDVVLTVLNIEGLNIHGGDLESMHKAIKMLYDSGKGVYLMKVLGRGKLAGRAKEALSYAFRIPYVHAVSVGIRSISELEEAVRVEEETEPLFNP